MLKVVLKPTRCVTLGFTLLVAVAGRAQDGPVATGDALSPGHQVRCIANQRYNEVPGKEGLCDVYLPDTTVGGGAADGRPVVVVVHGGAWMSGDKWTLEGYSRLLAQNGFVVVTINYRLAPVHKFPRQVDDVRQALIWTAEHADEYAIDLQRLGVFGYSAGGHLSALVGMLADEPAEVQQAASEWPAGDPRWKKIPRVAAVCAGGPPCDFRDLPLDNTGMAYFLGGSRRENEAIYKAASPTAHASSGDPPLQIIHGSADFMVPIASSRSLCETLKGLGVDVRFKTLPGRGHMLAFLDPQTRQTMLEFFQNVFIKPTLSVWDIRRLGHSPKWNWVDQESPIRELIYEGETIDGEATEVFAFYATPGSIASDPSLDKDLPAVVLVHGGGGTAFAPWVWLWAKRGYAAIAMDLSGRRPVSPTFQEGQLVVDYRGEKVRLDRGGPEQGSAQKFESVGGSLEDDWPMHAIGNVIRAHSLVRSFPEIDGERTALTGISWGGYTTCIVASIDDRFKAAVPVYGCGFLHDGQSVQRKQIDALSTEKRELWIQQYDPSSHLSYCRVPMLFVNGTNDQHYPLRSYSRSFALVRGEKNIRVEPNMKHSHQAGWAPEEIGLFIDSQLGGGLSSGSGDVPPLAVLGKLKRNGTTTSVDYESETKMVSATLHYTTDGGLYRDRKWSELPAVVTAGEITASKISVQGDADVLANATVMFITATDARGAMVSTDLFWPADAE